MTGPLPLRRLTSRLSSWAMLAVLAMASLAALTIPLTSEAREAPGRSMLPEVEPGQLPVQARTTLALIRSGGPFPYRKDGSVFGNRERLLPARPRGYYTEYTVPTPRSRDRGARRIIAAGDPRQTDEFYYTEDHYRSFVRIRDPGR